MANPRALNQVDSDQSQLSESQESVKAPPGGATTVALVLHPPAASAGGQVVAGRYELRGLLGRGGFGTVYRAWDRVLQRDVAVKMPHRRVNDEAISRAQLSEARLAAQLRHVGIVTVYDCGVDAEGRAYIVFEFVPGKTLSQFVAGRILPTAEAVRLVTAIAQALHAAHKCGLIHCDLKPANILIDQDGRPRIADFGLAVNELTQREKRGESAGTPAYMAPEQLRGEIHDCDGRTDIWALGVILYELLAGRRPFVGTEDGDLIEQILERPVRPPRQLNESIPRELEACCLRCLSKQVEDRFPSAIEVAEDLQGWLAGRPLGQTPPSSNLAMGRAAAGEPGSVRPASLSASRPQTKWSVGWKVVMATLVAGLLVGASATVWWSVTRPPASVVLPAAPPAPNEWHDLLAERPRTLATAGEGPRLDWNAQQRELAATAGYPTLIQLGVTEEPNFQIRLTLRQHPWNGRVGLFLAHGDDPSRPGASQFKLILLKLKNLPPSSGLALDRAVMTQEKAGRQAPIGLRSLAVQDVPHPGLSAATLEIEVRASQIKRITFAGRDCAELAAGPGALADVSPCSGPFGLFLDNSSIVVEKAEFRFTR